MEIPLRRRGGDSTESAFIDDEDADLVAGLRWRCHHSVYKGRVLARYAVSGTAPNVIFMHRLISGVAADFEVDHMDGDGLNNRRLNLRIVTHAQNLQNKKPYANGSGVRGVHLANGRWRAQARLAGVKYEVGTFATQEEAATAIAAWRAENMPFSRVR